MISQSYNLGEFIREVKDKDYTEIVALAEREVALAERRSFGYKGCVKEREKGSTRYAADLKGLLWSLKSGSRPAGVHVFPQFCPIFESLIARRQLRPEAIDIFGR